MKGKKLLILALAALMLLATLAGCAKNADDILGTVGETPIYRWYYEAHLKKQLALYEKYYGVDLTDPSQIAVFNEYRVKRLSDLVGETAMKEEARKQGFFELNAEQEAEIDAAYIDYYERNINLLLEQYGSDEQGRREAEKAYEQMLADNSLTPERVRETLKDEYVMQRFVESIGSKIDISEEEVRAEYDRLLKEQQEGCEADINWLGDNFPTVIVYAPEGYVKVSRIRKPFTQEQYAELSAAANNAQTAMNELIKAVQQDGENSVSANIKKSAYDRVNAVYESVFSRVSGELNETMKQFRMTIADAAQFKAASAVQTDEYSVFDYYVCATSVHVDEAFRDAAMALEIGEISDPVGSEQGSSIILAEEKLEPGVRDYEMVAEQIRESLNANKSITETFNLYSQYASEAEKAGIVELHPDKL